MPPKAKLIYVCTSCGCQLPKWQGRCPDCGSWNTVQEEVFTPSPAPKGAGQGRVVAPAQVCTIEEISATEEQRYLTTVGEFDRVLGGGIVPGSVVLLCGDPGIGKSTMLLQICRYLCRSLRVLYVSGEESIRQIKLRANRIGVTSENLLLTSTIDLQQVLDTLDSVKPDLLIIDSIQTMSLSTISSSPGSVTQVRECTGLLTQAAKAAEIPTFIIGHVNKDGGIAGPKVLEHMVDTVLYFEGEKNLSYRILRAIKNRFGSTNEIGVFEMSDAGLQEVENPSLMLLEGRPEDVSGTCVVCLMEGTRPILAEVQALVSKSGFGAPRRTSTGFDYNRTAMLIAVLEKRGGYFFGNLDTYINVVGGLKIDEPAADLAIAMALVSNVLDKPLSSSLVAFGEIGLTGEIRSVAQAQQRVGEAYRLGFRMFVVPRHCRDKIREGDYPDSQFFWVDNISQAFRVFGS